MHIATYRSTQYDNYPMNNLTLHSSLSANILRKKLTFTDTVQLKLHVDSQIQPHQKHINIGRIDVDVGFFPMEIHLVIRFIIYK